MFRFQFGGRTCFHDLLVYSAWKERQLRSRNHKNFHLLEIHPFFALFFLCCRLAFNSREFVRGFRLLVLCRVTHDDLFKLDLERLSRMCPSNVSSPTLISPGGVISSSEICDNHVRAQLTEHIMNDLTSILENLSVSTLMFVLCERGIDFVHCSPTNILSRKHFVKLIRKSCRPESSSVSQAQPRDPEESLETHDLKLKLEETDYSRQLLERKNSKLLRLLERVSWHCVGDRSPSSVQDEPQVSRLKTRHPTTFEKFAYSKTPSEYKFQHSASALRVQISHWPTTVVVGFV